jgi:hypothetical protein
VHLNALARKSGACPAASDATSAKTTPTEIDEGERIVLI